MTSHTNWAGQKVLITGINGFIGVHLARRLSEMGAQVEGTSRDTHHMLYLRAAGLEGKFRVHTADLKDEKPIAEIIRTGNYSAIFHLASQSDTWKSIDAPYETIRTNVGGTLNLLEAIRKSGKRPLVIISGTVRAFYDHTAHDPGVGLHPYDASKMGMELIALSYFHAYKIPGAIAKNTNVFGENDLNFSRLIPLIIKQALTGNKSIRLKGNGSVKRDYIHVHDVVNGMLALASNMDNPSVKGHSFTFATGEQISVREVCQQIQRALGKNTPVEFDENEELSDRNQPSLDTRHTTHVLGWKSAISFEKGIASTIDWYTHYFSEGKK